MPNPNLTSEEKQYQVLFPNHRSDSRRIVLTKYELSIYPCLVGQSISDLLKQEHTPLFEEAGLDMSVTCNRPNCPHQ